MAPGARRLSPAVPLPSSRIGAPLCEAQHPDDFLVYLLDQAPGVVCAAFKRQRESLRTPPKTAEEPVTTLESDGLIQAVGRLRQFIDLP